MGYPPAGYPPYPVPYRRTNTMAIISLSVALISLFSCPLIGGVAVYLGNRARAEINTSGEDGAGIAQAGTIIGWCAVALGVLLALFLVAYFIFFVSMFNEIITVGTP